MRLIRAIDKTATGAPALQKFAYLFAVSDITRWLPADESGIILPYSPKMKSGSMIYRLYLSPNTQEYSYETVGEQDERGFKTKFIGMHPGCMESALDFAKNKLDEGFIIMIPQCEDRTIVLGIPSNPMVFTSSHKGSREGRKFSFNFEQQIGSEEIYMLGNFKPWEDSTFRLFDKYFSKKFE